MGLLTDLLKDIHLSAVLKERLAMADKETESLKLAYSNLESKYAVSESENSNFNQLVLQKNQEIERLKQKIQELKESHSFPRGIRA